MGLFSKKPSKNKVYTAKEAMDFIRKNPDYTAVETVGGFNLITDKVAEVQINRYKKQNAFKREMTGDGAYKNIGMLEYNYQTNSRSNQVDLYR